MGRGDLFNVVTLGKGTKRSVDLPHPKSLSSFIKGPNMKYRFGQRYCTARQSWPRCGPVSLCLSSSLSCKVMWQAVENVKNLSRGGKLPF